VTSKPLNTAPGFHKTIICVTIHVSAAQLVHTMYIFIHLFEHVSTNIDHIMLRHPTYIYTEKLPFYGMSD